MLKRNFVFEKLRWKQAISYAAVHAVSYLIGQRVLAKEDRFAPRFNRSRISSKTSRLLHRSWRIESCNQPHYSVSAQRYALDITQLNRFGYRAGSWNPKKTGDFIFLDSHCL